MGCLCMRNKRELGFFPNHKRNHEAAEEFHGLCVCGSMCDLEDYWSQLGTATALPPRGSANKTQLLGKSTARRRQNISHRAGTFPARRGFHLPQSDSGPLEKKSVRNRTERNPHPPPPDLLLLRVSLLSSILPPAAQARHLGVRPAPAPALLPCTSDTHYA